MDAVRAYAGEGLSVVYEDAQGRKEVRTGGSRAWRNTNPGNVRFDARNKWQGQIGEAGGFCVFSERKWGERAVRLILAAYGRRGLTLGQTIACYAPAHENDVAAYVRAVVMRSRVGAEVLLAGLGEAQMAAVVGAIGVHEGWVVGEVYH